MVYLISELKAMVAILFLLNSPNDICNFFP